MKETVDFFWEFCSYYIVQIKLLDMDGCLGDTHIHKGSHTRNTIFGVLCTK